MLIIIGVISTSDLARSTSIGYASQQDDAEIFCSEGTMEPNETDCNAFDMCSNAKWVTLVCPNDLHFNADLKICDYPASAGCIIDGQPQDPKPKNDCPTTSFGALLGHPNCERYYICDYGVPLEQKCPYGQHWSIEANYCDYTNLANCQYDASPEQPGAVLLPTSTTTTIIETSLATTTPEILLP